MLFLPQVRFGGYIIGRQATVLCVGDVARSAVEARGRLVRSVLEIDDRGSADPIHLA
jgi:hypothetical protein